MCVDGGKGQNGVNPCYAVYKRHKAVDPTVMFN